MSTIKVCFEIGHTASLKSKKSPEGFTHDWEVFVRGTEGADISHFVEKVVFHLHETFPKPRRVVKEPPFSISESGYAGFIFPIEIYLKNKDEPKKITFSYDFTLQRTGSLKDRFIFQNPNDDFKKKLLKGGGIVTTNNAFYTNPDQENRSRDSFTEEKQQLVSKPKLSSENVKKHKSKEYKEEIPHKTSSFETLFGAPIQKPPKVSPDPKKVEKNAIAIKSQKKEKDRSSSDKKSKHEHKEPKSEKVKMKDEKDKIKAEKLKNHKDAERTKDKPSKRPNERPPSPDLVKKRCVSPVRRPQSPSQRSNSASSIKEEYKSKHLSENFESKKPKNEVESRPVEVKVEKEGKEKKKKEKKSHDRDKERKEKKEHKKESHKVKDSPKESPKELLKVKEVIKEKEQTRDTSHSREKPQKPEKIINKFSIERLRKTPPPEAEEHVENRKSKEKGDSERKHKHKKKDKKRDESKEKHKESSKEKKSKHEKVVKEPPPEKPEIIERRETPNLKERSIPEPASPISIDTASQCSSKSGLVKASHISTEDVNSSHSDSEVSLIADEDDDKVKIENPSPVVKHDPSPEPEPEPEPEAEPELEPVVEPPPLQQKEKSKKHKDRSKREEKRRKRKAAEEEEIESRKMAKTNELGVSNNDTEHGESSGSVSAETKVQDNGVSSSLGEDAEPGDLSPDYMVQLRGLQQRIMMIKNNEDLERVVNLIAETGRYEVTTQTFDFDLCMLDRSTVQQLIQLVGC
ncbi:protein AF-9 [Papilio machaon]|uniref:protein AF-9 n=1 Tax=Papilio machaon TaxID=76193 RepID=UPI001E663543|nr:protein AF-9 [Papilio machaon]